MMSNKLQSNTQMLALGYLRISDKKQIEGESKNTQKAIITAYAADHNIKILDWYYDEAKSGKNTEREELQNMLRAAVKYKGKINYIIVWRMSRAGRDITSYIMGIKSILIPRGIQIRSATEPFDDSPMGKYMEHLYILNAQLENDNKREIVVDNMAALSHQGYWRHGPIRGYKRHTLYNDEGKPRPSMLPNHEADKVLQLLMRWNIGDLRPAELTRYATSISLLNRAGRPLTQEVVQKMIERPEYAGYVHDRFTDYELVDGKHPALISPEIYWQNQELLKRKSKDYLIGLKHKSVNEVAPLSRFVLCSVCYMHLTRSNPGGKYRYYCARKSCRGTGSILVASMHEKFEKLLQDVTPKPGTVKLMKEILTRTSVKQLDGLNGEISTLRRKLDEIAQMRVDTIKEFVSKGISKDDKEAVIDDLDFRKLEIQSQLDELEAQQMTNEASIEYALNFMQNIAYQWSNSPLSLKIKFQALIFPDGFVYDIKNDNFIINKISPLYSSNFTINEADSDKNSVLVNLSEVDSQKYKLLSEYIRKATD